MRALGPREAEHQISTPSSQERLSQASASGLGRGSPVVLGLQARTGYGDSRSGGHRGLRHAGFSPLRNGSPRGEGQAVSPPPPARVLRPQGVLQAGAFRARIPSYVLRTSIENPTFNVPEKEKRLPKAASTSTDKNREDATSERGRPCKWSQCTSTKSHINQSSRSSICLLGLCDKPALETPEAFRVGPTRPRERHPGHTGRAEPERPGRPSGACAPR